MQVKWKARVQVRCHRATIGVCAAVSAAIVIPLRISVLGLIALSPFLELNVAHAQQRSAPSDAWKDVKDLLAVQQKKLQDMEKRATRTLYIGGDVSSPVDKSGFCVRFWERTKRGSLVDIPGPLIIARNRHEKDQVMAKLANYAQSNFNRFQLQAGILSPAKYETVEGRQRSLGPGLWKGSDKQWNALKQKFNASWRRGPILSDFSGPNGVFGAEQSIHLLYLFPYPISGYARPLVISRLLKYPPRA